MASDIIKSKIGESIELLIEGIPSSIITPVVQAKVALSLVKHGLPNAGAFSAGILGGLKTATLQIGGEYYQLKYSVNVLKPVTALEMYQEAVAWIKFQEATNSVDSDLANEAINYLRSEFSHDFGSNERGGLHGDSTTDAPPPDVSKKKK
jgi:hypothetical protein